MNISKLPDVLKRIITALQKALIPDTKILVLGWRESRSDDHTIFLSQEDTYRLSALPQNICGIVATELVGKDSIVRMCEDAGVPYHRNVKAGQIDLILKHLDWSAQETRPAAGSMGTEDLDAAITRLNDELRQLEGLKKKVDDKCDAFAPRLTQAKGVVEILKKEQEELQRKITNAQGMVDDLARELREIKAPGDTYGQQIAQIKASIGEYTDLKRDIEETRERVAGIEARKQKLLGSKK